MELPYEKKQPTMADLKEKDTRLITKFCEFTNSEEMNCFINDLEKIANNPNKYSILTFDCDKGIDGIPFCIVRYKCYEKIEENKERRFILNGKIFTKYDFSDLDEIINKHDHTTLRLLAEKRFVLKNGDFFTLLIWAEIVKQTKFTEGLDVLRSIFSTRLY